MDDPQTLGGRVVELSPFEITVTEAPKTGLWKLAAWSRASVAEVLAEELYGCVDWYQYPEARPDENQRAS